MGISKIINKKSKDPFDKVIFEKGLRINNSLIEKDLDPMAIVLNNGIIIKNTLSSCTKLKKAPVQQLQNWRLISGGIGINGPALNEDLSLKRFIQQSSLEETFRLLQAKPPMQKVFV